MRKLLHNKLQTGFLTIFLGLMSISSQAQKPGFDWNNPDMPYVEQRGFSIGMNVGMSEIWGDVGTFSLVDRYTNPHYQSKFSEQVRGMGGLFVRYTHVPGLALRWGINYGQVFATDRWNKDKASKAKFMHEDAVQRYMRNLDINTSIWETNLLLEFSPLRIANWEFGSLPKMRFQPYVLLGLTGFYFNPRGSHLDLETNEEKWIDLRPLRTEGQGFKAPGYAFPETYNVFSYGIVGGGGVKVDIGRALAVGLEFQLRYTFTDYLDDASGRYVDPLHFDIAYQNDYKRHTLSQHMSDKTWQVAAGRYNPSEAFRGNPDDTDKFSTISLMFFWKIKKRDSPWWSSYR